MGHYVFVSDDYVLLGSLLPLDYDHLNAEAFNEYDEYDDQAAAAAGDDEDEEDGGGGGDHGDENSAGYVDRMCIYIYIYLSMHTYTHTHIHICMYVCMYVCMYACTYVRMYACIHRYKCTQIHVSVWGDR